MSGLSKIEPRYLYRGVARAGNRDIVDGLRPKKTGAFTYVFHAGEVVDSTSGRVLRVGEGAVAGESDVNAVLRHQIDPEAGRPTAGVSTTPTYERAKYYATHGYSSQEGYVLKIDRKLLAPHGVDEYRVSDVVPQPSVPQDDEYILVATNEGALPKAIVVDRFEV